MVEAAGQQIPTWRSKPEPVSIKVELLGKDWSGRLLASFTVGGKKYVATVDAALIDEKTNSMRALIIADVGRGFLVDLPGESLSAGSRIHIGKDELRKLVLSPA